MAMNPYSKYQEQAVMTMTRGEMLIKLYDGAIKNLHNGLHFMQLKDVQQTNTALQKAQAIIGYLKATLDNKYEISGNLTSLYDFFNNQIMLANVRKQPKLIEEVLPMLEELRDTFAQADKIARMEKQPAASTVAAARLRVG